MKIAYCVSLSAALALTPALTAGGGEPTGPVVTTTLSAIRAAPDSYNGIWVRFTVQFASMGKIQNPFFTQFVPYRFANFYTWPDEKQIWKKKEYEDLFGLLFIAKDNPQTQTIYSTRVYQRMVITGVVRSIFQGEPWIEVTEFEFVAPKVNTATLSHMFRGETHIKKRQWKQAIAELSLAPAVDLPPLVTGHIHKDLALCYLRLGEVDTAVSHLESAVNLLQSVDHEIQRMAKLAKVRPETFLDRTLGSAEVEDYQRPMWEAFAGRPASGQDPTPAKK